MSAPVPRQHDCARTLKPGVSSTFSCAAGGTPFSVTGAAGASDIGEQGTGGGVSVEMNSSEPVSSCQTWGLRKKRRTGWTPDF